MQDKIAKLNDEFRRSGQGVVVTPGVQELPDIICLMAAVGGFDDFTEDDDPYGEHDFGSLEWRRHKVFWKIDYYDQKLECGADPLSPSCKRVLTVMLASEY